MGTTKHNTLRRDIWQEDLERISEELSAKGFDIRRIRTLIKGIRCQGQSEQNFYRVVFKKKPEEQQSPVKQKSDQRETVGSR